MHGAFRIQFRLQATQLSHSHPGTKPRQRHSALLHPSIALAELQPPPWHAPALDDPMTRRPIWSS